MMAATWLSYGTLNGRWLVAATQACNSRCSLSNSVAYMNYGLPLVVAAAGLLLATGVWAARPWSVVIGSALHLAAICHLGSALDRAPDSETAVNTIIVLGCGLAHLALSVILVGCAVALREQQEERK